MRIIAGRLGGRLFSSPGTHKTHPMSDKIRGALFNTLGELSGMRVLDAFAGSGALGFEAVSRGAAYVVAIESDRKAQTVIQSNIRELGVSGRVKLIKASANAWLSTSEGAKFDIILCDPPYDSVQPALLLRLAECARPGGIVVFSLPPTTNVELPEDFKQIGAKNYGDSHLFFFERR